MIIGICLLFIGICAFSICHCARSLKTSKVTRSEGYTLPNHGHGGFTLVELIVVVVVLTVFVGVAIPGFQGILRNMRIRSQANDFVATLLLARSEALKRGAATICPSSTGLGCAGGKSWEIGWILFADKNANGALDSGEHILLVEPALSGENTFRSGARTRVTYHLDGYPQGFNDSFRICDARGMDFARTVILSNVGRIRTISGASVCP